MTKVVIAAILGALLVVAVLFVAVSPQTTAETPSQTHSTELAAESATCATDTGGRCWWSCETWRKGATCHWGQCVCPSGTCAYQGECTQQDVVPKAPPPPPVCRPTTGASCAVFACSKSSNAECSGFSVGFSSLPTMGQCICKTGQCANDHGVCVDSPQFFRPRKLEAKQIVCPVLSAIWNAGDFKTDKLGRVERIDVQSGIVDGTGATDFVGFGFAQATAAYRANDPDEQNFAMFDVTAALKGFADGVKKAPAGEERYLNIFRMLQNKDVLHQIGAAVRGGPLDPNCTDYPCLSRFGSFFGRFANSKGLLCTTEFGEIAANIYNHGYHGVAADKTIFSTLGFTFREFSALAGFLKVFGKPQGGWPDGGDICMTLKDAQHLEMVGTFPPGWEKPSGWSIPDIFAIVEVWRKQKVEGLAVSLTTQSSIWSFFQMAKKAKAARNNRRIGDEN